MPDSLEKNISDAGSFLSEASTWIPEWLPNSTWIEHAPFAFWLIEAHEPEVLIELGTYMGYSFFAFCQAIARLKLSTRAYAVDTWKGDEHGGFYGEEVFQEVSKHNAERYSSFSQLIRSTFDDALPYFEDGSVDLLHIDGRHFYEDVKHDFKSWLPKLSDRGIVLLHDINVRERSFGVFRYWAELSQSYPHFQFFHGWGLGVLGVGKKLPRPLKAIFEFQGNSKRANKVRNIYARLGASLDDRSARRRSASEIGLKEAEASALKAQISTLEAHVANSRGVGEAALSELSDVRSRLLASEAQGAELEAALTMRTGELSAAKTEFAEKERKTAQQRSDLETALCETRQKLDSSKLQLAAAQAALTQQNEDAAQQRADLKSRLADGRQQLQSTAAQLAAARNEHQVALRDIRRDLASTMAQLDAAKAQLAESTAELARQRDDTVRQRAGLEAQRAASQERAVTAQALCERLRAEHDGVLTSSFWRATAPARRLVAILPQGVRRQARRGARLLYWALTPHRTAARIAHLRARRESIRKNNNPAWAALFDRDWYLERYPDVAAGADKGDPLRHFIHHGAAERRDPNPFFDTSWYLETNPDVARAGDNALAHYFEHGAAEGRDPSPLFDTSWYLEANSDVAEAGTNPLFHYLRHGATEGRAARASEPLALVTSLSGTIARISLVDAETNPENYGAAEGSVKQLAIRADVAAARSSLGREFRLDKPCTIAVGVVIYDETEEQVRTIFRSARAACRLCPACVEARFYLFDNGGRFPANQVPDGVKLILGGADEGFGTGHNKLMSYAFEAGAKVYIGANPDGEFHPDCVVNMLRMSEASAGRSLIEAVQFPEEHPKIYDPETLETPWISGACFLISLVIWRATGGFDSNIYLYCDDVDLSWRCRHLGFKTQICPSALFYHDTSGRPHESWRYREMLVSARYLGHKWRCTSFIDWADAQLIELGLAAGKHELPPLEDLPTIEGATVADFSHGFHFAPVRWQ